MYQTTLEIMNYSFLTDYGSFKNAIKVQKGEKIKQDKSRGSEVN